MLRIPIFIAAVLVVYSTSGCATPLNTKAIDQAKIFQLLTSLFIVALFFERSLEVFITTGRGATTEKLNNAGGSDGIHHILQAVITFMDATAKRAKGEMP